jgi:hypothetical protein
MADRPAHVTPPAYLSKTTPVPAPEPVKEPSATRRGSTRFATATGSSRASRSISDRRHPGLEPGSNAFEVTASVAP